MGGEAAIETALLGTRGSRTHPGNGDGEVAFARRLGLAVAEGGSGGERVGLGGADPSAVKIVSAVPAS